MTAVLEAAHAEEFRAGSWIDGYQAVSPAPVDLKSSGRHRRVDGWLVKGAWSDPWWVYDPERGWAVAQRWRSKAQDSYGYDEGGKYVSAPVPACEVRELLPWPQREPESRAEPEPEPASDQEPQEGPGPDSPPRCEIPGPAEYPVCRRCNRETRAWPLQRGDRCSPKDWRRCIRDPFTVAAENEPDPASEPEDITEGEESMGVTGAVRTVQRIDHALKNGQEKRQDGSGDEGNGGLPEPQPAPLPPGITGAMVLDDARAFAASILYATDEQLDALTLACAVSHTLDSFSTVPELLFTSTEKESGKTTAQDIAAMLANNGWSADPTSYALRAKFNEPEKPTLIIDEVSDIFGRSGLRGAGNHLGKILRICYRRTATLSMAVDRVAEEVSCYTMAVLGGLKTAVPDDIRSRCVIFQMRPLPASVKGLRDSQDDDTLALGKIHGQRLHQWARGSQDEIRRAFRNIRRPHPKFYGRRAQIWGPMYALALEAGENWPERCLAAFKAMALDASDVPVLSPPQMILRDAAALFARDGAGKLFAAGIAAHLRSLPDVELYENLTDRGLAQLMTEALGPSQSMDIGTARARGFHAGPVIAAWKRLEAQLEPPEDDEPEEDEFDSMFEITEVTEVTDGAR